MERATAEQVQIFTRVDEQLHADLSELANAAERSVAAEVRLALRAWVDSRKAVA